MASSPRNRVPSAPHRFHEPTSSQYHAKCVSNPSVSRNQRAKSANSNILPVAVSYDQFQKGSTVVQDEVWKSSCTKEKYQQTKWEKNWGFLAQYDQKGNPKEPKELNEDATSLYSETVPNTSNGHYGLRTRSPNASYIQKLERTGHNLRKNKELLYYD